QGDGLLPGRRGVVLLVVAVEPGQVRHRVQQRRRVGHGPMVAATGASGEGQTSRRQKPEGTMASMSLGPGSWKDLASSVWRAPALSTRTAGTPRPSARDTKLRS